MTVTFTVPAGTTLAQAFPTDTVDPEQLVYQEIKAAVAPGPACQLPYYGDARPNQPEITHTQGWPAYPGKVPAIGVAEGTESEDQSREVLDGGFVDDVVAVDPTGSYVGSASYYSEPLYTPVVVTLIHENRDERDRLHRALRLVLFPLRRALPTAHQRVFKVTVDAEKSEVSGGPPAVQKPFLIYTSVFTVHVQHELLQPQHVTDATGVVTQLPVTLESLT